MAANCDAQAKLVYLDFISDLTIGVAWPTMVLLLSFVFRHEIRELVRRIKQVGPGVIHLGQAGQDTTTLEESFSSKLDSGLEPLRDEIAKDLERTYREHYEAIQGPEKFDYLLRDLTLQSMQKSFAIVYSEIFGSQIRLLRDLNARIMSRAEVEHFFLNLQASNPAFSSWNMEIYMAFLLNWKLIEFDSINYKISQTGRDFLYFLTGHNLNENRPY